jgi:Tfp pilus assembly pilus retraction ATPase PilT
MDREIGWLKRERLSDDEHRHALAHQLGVPFVTLGRDDISLEALLLIPEPIAREHNAVGFKLNDHSLEVALLSLEDLEHLGFLQLRYRVLPRLTTRDSLRSALVHYQRHLQATYGVALQREESPNLLDTLLRHALHSGASDVHLQQDGKGLLVRYRIHGALRDAMTLSSTAGKNIMTKLRALAGLAGGLPHEARVRVDLGNGEDVAVRVSTVPVLHGEKMVMSLVREKARRGYTLESLGLHGEALERVHGFLLRRRGLMTLEGGEGAGKSTLLYTLVDALNTPELSIATIEREVSHAFPRVAQTDLISSGLSMAAALRAALRTDPDVVAIDSINEQEVADIARAAAKRGVLVIAAVEDPALLPAADLAIKTAVARKLCTKQFLDKRKLTRVQSDTLEERANFASVLGALKGEGKVEKDTPWKDIQFPWAVPCSHCEDGYDGLIGLQEVAAGGETIGLTLAEDGLFKAHQGLTDLNELQKALF